MKESIFTRLKVVRVSDAANRLGIMVNKHFCCCPIHGEKTASCRIYEDHFYCYGCHASGDSVALYKAVLGLSPMEAAKALASDFNINIDGLDAGSYKPPQLWERYKESEQYRAEQMNKYYRIIGKLKQKREQLCAGGIPEDEKTLDQVEDLTRTIMAAEKNYDEWDQLPLEEVQEKMQKEATA